MLLAKPSTDSLSSKVQVTAGDYGLMKVSLQLISQYQIPLQQDFLFLQLKEMDLVRIFSLVKN